MIINEIHLNPQINVLLDSLLNPNSCQWWQLSVSVNFKSCCFLNIRIFYYQSLWNSHRWLLRLICTSGRVTRVCFVSPEPKEKKKKFLFVRDSLLSWGTHFVCVCVFSMLAYLKASLLSTRHGQSDEISAFSDKAWWTNFTSVSHSLCFPSNFSPRQQISFVKEPALCRENLKLLQRCTSWSVQRGWQGGPHIFSFGVKADSPSRGSCSGLDRTWRHQHMHTHH